MKALHAMSDLELQEYMRKLSHAVEQVLPPGPSKHGKCTFALVLADEDGKAHYISNSRRQRMTRALRKTVDRLERRRSNSRLVVLKPPAAVNS
jgi:hypothetical protein